MVDQKPVAPPSDVDGVSEEKRKYKKILLKRVLFLVACVILLIVISGIYLTIGSAHMTFFDAYAAVFARFFPQSFTVSPLADTVVWTLRLPRLRLGILAGAPLAMAGASTQEILRNPIATPYSLGVSAGAGLGAAIGIIFGTGFAGGEFVIIGNAFVFSLIPVFVILLLIKRSGAAPETIILAGVAIMYIFSAAQPFCSTLPTRTRSAPQSFGWWVTCPEPRVAASLHTGRTGHMSSH
jgi:iron complex transport system permease protein